MIYNVLAVGDVVGRCGVEHLRRTLRPLKKKLDYNETGGTLLLGISKPVIKAHGSSDPEATVSAIRQAYKYVQAGILEEITEKAPILAAFKSEKKEQPEG